MDPVGEQAHHTERARVTRGLSRQRVNEPLDALCASGVVRVRSGGVRALDLARLATLTRSGLKAPGKCDAGQRAQYQGQAGWLGHWVRFAQGERGIGGIGDTL